MSGEGSRPCKAPLRVLFASLSAAMCGSDASVGSTSASRPTPNDRTTWLAASRPVTYARSCERPLAPWGTPLTLCLLVKYHGTSGVQYKNIWPTSCSVDARNNKDDHTLCGKTWYQRTSRQP